IFSQRTYPSPLNAARPSTDSLRSPTPGRLASVNLAARQFLAIAYFALLVTASGLAGLTALNASLFCISRTVGLFRRGRPVGHCHCLPSAPAGQPHQRPHQPDWSAVICFFLKFLNFLKLLIVCHALPSDLRLCRDTSPALPCQIFLPIMHIMSQIIIFYENNKLFYYYII
ncbi:MAG: hypothetical protein IKB71_07250, partial [Lentisphaeria bacterium]|nr:hypothetical protein [Lentisphaeria bacterium]